MEIKFEVFSLTKQGVNLVNEDYRDQDAKIALKVFRGAFLGISELFLLISRGLTYYATGRDLLVRYDIKHGNDKIRQRTDRGEDEHIALLKESFTVVSAICEDTQFPKDFFPKVLQIVAAIFAFFADVFIDCVRIERLNAVKADFSVYRLGVTGEFVEDAKGCVSSGWRATKRAASGAWNYLSSFGSQ